MFEKRPASTFLLLNPDCLVDSDPGPLASWLAANRRAGVCGAIVREVDGSIQASARRFPGVTTGLAGRTSWLTRVWPRNPGRNAIWSAGFRRTGRGRLGERRLHDGPPRRVLAIGGMDEQFFLYWEDADFCMRLRQAGWLTYYSPAMSVTHLTGRSSQHAREASLVAFHESAYRYYRKARRSMARAAGVPRAAGTVWLKLAMLRRGDRGASVMSF